MRRREFLKVIGGFAAVPWPLTVHAQQPALPVAGFLSSLSPQELALVMPAFQGPQRGGLCRGSQYHYRVPLGGGTL